MDIFLRPKDSGDEWFRFPLMPDRISVSTAAAVVTVTVINTGEIRIPRGNQLTSYAWQGALPGEHMSDASFVFDWQPPQTIIQRLREWQETGTTLNLMVTELSINADVFIQTLQYEYHGAGDCDYNISLSVRKELTVSVVPKPLLPEDTPEALGTGDGSGAASGATQTGEVTGGSVYYRKGPGMSYSAYGTYHKGDKLSLISKSGNWWKFVCDKVKDGFAWMSAKYIKVTGNIADTETQKTLKQVNKTTGSGKNTYTVKEKDTLYTIAKAQLGDGTRYEEIYKMNQSAIDTMNKDKEVSKYTIYVGLILKLPS